MAVLGNGRQEDKDPKRRIRLRMRGAQRFVCLERFSAPHNVPRGHNGREVGNAAVCAGKSATGQLTNTHPPV
ncbi:hypothetical protein MPL1032_230041 [Mesorhizobium plurifarium]|uniref:Uncharacterized protein n=1 Tax=Mesorhizobium plurifarium TaxID=69974 RepID=A0A0K2VZW4_MESPL|nr:hypothetical protein MPL1032_230041 [Mesorhizobium plurifarium]